jgi:hypothetical protein
MYPNSNLAKVFRGRREHIGKSIRRFRTLIEVQPLAALGIRLVCFRALCLLLLRATLATVSMDFIIGGGPER